MRLTWQWCPWWSKSICNVKNEIFKLPWKALQKQSLIYSQFSRFPSEFTVWDLSLSNVLKHYSLVIYSLQIRSHNNQFSQLFVVVVVVQGDWEIKEKEAYVHIYTLCTYKYRLKWMYVYVCIVKYTHLNVYLFLLRMEYHPGLYPTCIYKWEKNNQIDYILEELIFFFLSQIFHFMQSILNYFF